MIDSLLNKYAIDCNENILEENQMQRHKNQRKKKCIWNPIPDKNFENRYPIPDSCPVDNQFLLLYRL